MKSIIIAVLGILLVPFMFVLAALIGLVMAYPIMWAWNYLMPVFGIHTLTYWQSFCVYVLSYFLILANRVSIKE